MSLERTDQGFRKNGASIFVAFRVANVDLVVPKVEIFHAQANAFIDTKTASIEQLDDESVTIVHAVDDLEYFFASEHGGESFWAPGAHILEWKIKR